MANTPLLTTHFRYHNKDTQELIQTLWDAIDSRKRGASDYKSGHAVLAGIFALRHEETFAVNKRTLTRAEGRSWDLILERHMGSLLRRSSGKNRYSLSPEFTAATSVVESSDATLLMRVEGQGVRYTTPQAIPNAPSVALINGLRAMPVYVLDLGTIFEMIVSRTKFPPRWQQLPNKPLSHRSLELVASWYDYVDHQMLKQGYNAIRVQHGNSPNRIAFCVSQPRTIDFGRHLLDWSTPWFKSNQLKLTIPATEVHDRASGRVNIVDGSAYQQTLEQRAGHADAA
jgi:hypothetical protein